MGITGQIHTDGTGHIIINNGCYGTLGDSDVRFFKESQVTAGTDHNLTGNINEVVFVFLTDAIQEHILVLGSLFVRRSIQRRKVLHVVIQRFAEFRCIGTDFEVSTHSYLCVICRGNGHRVSVTAGRTNGAAQHIIRIQITLTQETAVDTIDCAVALVAGRYGYHSIRLLQTLHNQLIITGIGEACNQSTQREVNGVATQNDRILNSCHEVGSIGAAHFAEYLHNNDLRIGRIACYFYGFQCIHHLTVLFNVAVCGCNTGHMRTMVSSVILFVGDIVVKAIHIVKRKGDFCAIVSLVSCGRFVLADHMKLIQFCRHLFLIQKIQRGYIFFIAYTCCRRILLQGIQECFFGKRLVIRIQAGVNDCNSHTCAGVACLPGGTRSGHAGGTGHQRVCIRAFHAFRHRILTLQYDFLHAFNLRDFLNLSVLDVGRNHIGHQCQIPLNIQILTQYGFNRFHDFILTLCQFLTIGHCFIIFRNAIGRIALVNRRILL